MTRRQRGNACENFNGTTDNTMTLVVVVVVVVGIHGPHAWEGWHTDEIGWALEKVVSVSQFCVAPRLLLQRNA